MSSEALQSRFVFAKKTARKAGIFARQSFLDLSNLKIEKKGVQDFVSEADRATERLIRAELAEHFPDDGILGEEYGKTVGTSGYTWVIDPIDGTANFVTGIPAWCVVISCVSETENLLGVVFEPSNNELFAAIKGGGATINEKPCSVAKSEGLHDGSVAIGSSSKTRPAVAADFVAELIKVRGMFFRNASGALSLSYVAGGRLIGYLEAHMNAWDCLAGMLLIEEAGGRVQTFDMQEMLEKGGPVLAACPDVFDDLHAIAIAHL